MCLSAQICIQGFHHFHGEPEAILTLEKKKKLTETKIKSAQAEVSEPGHKYNCAHLTQKNYFQTWGHYQAKDCQDL